MTHTHTEPLRDRSDFVDFLTWMADECREDTHAIIRIVEKPWNYEAEYREYRAAREAEEA